MNHTTRLIIFLAINFFLKKATKQRVAAYKNLKLSFHRKNFTLIKNALIWDSYQKSDSCFWAMHFFMAIIFIKAKSEIFACSWLRCFFHYFFPKKTIIQSVCVYPNIQLSDISLFLEKLSVTGFWAT